MADQIQIRRDTASNWASVNPILAQGELGIELDTLKGKVGDGTTVWNSLGYSFMTSTGNLIAGDNITLDGSLNERLLGSGNVTINAIASGGGSFDGFIDYPTAWYTFDKGSNGSRIIGLGEVYFYPLKHTLISKNNVRLIRFAIRFAGSGVSTFIRFGIYERTTANNLSLVADCGNVAGGIGTVELAVSPVTLDKTKTYYIALKRDDTSSSPPELQSNNAFTTDTEYSFAPDPSTMFQTSQTLMKTGASVGTFASTDTLPLTTANVDRPNLLFRLEKI